MADYSKLIDTLRRMAEKSAGFLMMTGWKDSDGLPKLYRAAADAIEELTAFPAADVAPVVHGKWTEIKGVYDKRSIWYRCDRCGQSAEKMFLSKYCPNCGARMDGGAEND